jgi:beta-lactamase regulating signal transducer with metallopeptidase domain
MIGAVLDHLWQSTLFALAVALVTAALGKAPASFRHGLWFAASAKFLIPFAALEAVGRLLAPAAPRLGAAPDIHLIAQAAKPFSQSLPQVTALRAPAAIDPALVLLAIWALGFAVVLIAWRAPWAKVRAALRSAAPLAWPAPMPVLASDAMLEPGLVGLWRPVLLVPATLFDHLGPPEIEAIVAHESCHLRRRDNLTATLQMLVEATFWFHPLVWWIGARMIEERERACDEAVVAAGHDRAAYVRGLLESCRLYLQSPLPCVAGASGSNLKTRVRRIMTAPTSKPVSSAVKAALLVAVACAIATPVTAGLLAAPMEHEASALATVGMTPLAPAPAAPTGAPARGVRSAPRNGGGARPASLRRGVAASAAEAFAQPADAAPIAPVAAQGLAPSRMILAALSIPAPVAAPAILRIQPTQPPAVEIAETAAAVGPSAEVGRMVCRKEAMTGSRFVKRICVTEGQWDEQQRRLFAFERQRSLDPTGAPAASHATTTDADNQ